MKKILFAIAIVMMMGFCANADNTDSWFLPSNEGGVRNDVDTPGMPLHSGTSDADAPLGSGLLILTALGAGYALKKRNA